MLPVDQAEGSARGRRRGRMSTIKEKAERVDLTGRRYRQRAVALVAAVVVSISLAACSSGDTGDGDMTDAPSAVPSLTAEEGLTLSPSPSPEPSTTTQERGELDEYGLSYESNEYLGIHAAGREFTDAYGTYNRVAIDDDARILERTASAYSQSAMDIWDYELLVAGEKTAKRFILELMMDNQSIYDSTPENMKAYLAESSELIVPEWRETWLDADASEGHLGAGRTDISVPLYVNAEDATFPEYVPGQARYVLQNMTLTDAYASDEPGEVIFAFDMILQRPASIRIGDDEYVKGFINITQERLLALRPLTGGQFQIAGWYGSLRAFPHHHDGTQILDLYSENH